jgi:hypothetical protein
MPRRVTPALRHGLRLRRDDGRAGIWEIARVTTETFATMVSLFGTGGLKPGAGPARKVREKGFYDILFLGELPDGGRVEAVVTDDRDPGYDSTSKMIAESALCTLPAQPGRPMTPNPSWISRRGRSRTAIPRQKSRARIRLRQSWAPALTFHRPDDAGRCRPAARLRARTGGRVRPFLPHIGELTRVWALAAHNQTITAPPSRHYR